MDEQVDVFFYDEENRCISSLTQYHAENLSIEPLVEAHPDVIYFYLGLTDPFPEEPEIDYNTSVMMTDRGLHHTYQPKCPEGCHGQLDDCIYKNDTRIEQHTKY